MKILLLTVAIYVLYLIFQKKRKPQPGVYLLFDYHKPSWYKGEPPRKVHREVIFLNHVQ